MVRLQVMLGTWLAVVNMDIDFLIINALNNTMLGRTSLNKAKVIVSSPPSINKVSNNQWDQLSLSQLGSNKKVLYSLFVRSSTCTKPTPSWQVQQDLEGKDR